MSGSETSLNPRRVRRSAGQNRLSCSPTLTGLIALLFAALFSSCSLLMVDSPRYNPTDRILLVVDDSIYIDISPSLREYMDEITREGGSVYLERFGPDGTAANLRGLTTGYADYVDSAFYIGAIPVVWYEQTAYIFKDNDWYDFNRGSSFGLDSIYSDIQISQDDDTTSRAAYLSYINNPGAEYVYQWVHANPAALYFSENDSFDSYSYFQVDPSINGRFINMFDCKAVRFTEANMGMSYLTQTDRTLAVTGSTKVGGNYYPLEFHRQLSVGNSWGYAFVSWYNDFGRYDDEWFLGMAILGDPSLRIRAVDPAAGVSRSSIQAVLPPGRDKIDALGLNLQSFDLEISQQ